MGARALLLLAGLAVGVPAGAVEVVDGVALPRVPLAVLAAGRAAAPAAATPEAPAPAVLESGPYTVRMVPGVNVVVEAALGHLNRLVTPFAAPRVRTVAEATTEVEGRAVYVAVPGEEPVSLFLSDAADPDTTLSLTLWPKRIPPREIVLQVAGGAAAAGPARAVAQRWETAQPYPETLVLALRALALGRVPPGYGPRPAGADEPVRCTQPGLEVHIERVLEGHALRLVSARARNRGRTPLELDERTCGAGPGAAVLAVAAWPRVWLEPGAGTALYLAVRPAARPGDRP